MSRLPGKRSFKKKYFANDERTAACSASVHDLRTIFFGFFTKTVHIIAVLRNQPHTKVKNYDEFRRRTVFGIHLNSDKIWLPCLLYYSFFSQ